ncbi:hypothetical protein LEMLEM_LOCUS13983, partial [Lemmus lemmus]
ELRPRACWALNSCITKTSWDLDGYSCSLNPTCSNKPGRPQMADGGYWTLRLRICLEDYICKSHTSWLVRCLVKNRAHHSSPMTRLQPLKPMQKGKERAKPTKLSS